MASFATTKNTYMPKYSSHLLVAQLQQQTEKILDTAITQWQMMPHSDFARKPLTGGWSANECLQHLNSYGDYYLPAIHKAIITGGKTNTANPVFTSGLLGNYFTKLMAPATGNKPLKKMKAPAPHTPTSIIESHMVIATFIDQQEQLLHLLEKSKSLDMNRLHIPISISRFIKMKLGDTFHFLVMHNLRHVVQAQKALGFNTVATPFALPTRHAIL